MYTIYQIPFKTNIILQERKDGIKDIKLKAYPN